MDYTRLIFLGLLPTVLVIIFFFLNKWKTFNNLNYWIKQIIYGLAFGGSAVLCTEFGVPMNGAIMNVRDAPIIIAGLLYGAPAGILAGLIGGIERAFSVIWNASYYTQVACTVASILSGFVGAALHFFIYKKNRVTAGEAFFYGSYLEAVHIFLIFLTNLNDSAVASEYVMAVGMPMILGVSISCFIAVLMQNIMNRFLGKDHSNHIGITFLYHKNKIRVSGLVLIFLLVASLLGFGIAQGITYRIQTNVEYSKAQTEISQTLDDVTQDLKDYSDYKILTSAVTAADDLNNQENFDSDYLKAMVDFIDVSEVHYINSEGIVEYSTVEASLGYNMAFSGQSAEFLVLLDGETPYYIQDYMPTSQDPNVSKMYAGYILRRGGFVQVGYDSDKYFSLVDEIAYHISKNRHVMNTGEVIIANSNKELVSLKEEYAGLTLDEIGLNDIDSIEENVTKEAKINKENAYYSYVLANGYYFICLVPTAEVSATIQVSTYIASLVEYIIVGFVMLLVTIGINVFILRDLFKMNDNLNTIVAGDLNARLSEKNHTYELQNLSKNINSTVDSLGDYIKKESERIETEMKLAKSIQSSALPSPFAYLARHEFDVSALMQTARTVGGDFYDYFMIGENKIAILVADVSGKGFPASLFMMQTKSIIKSYAEMDLPVEKVITKVNQKLNEKNETNTFVTVWMGIVDLTTGICEYVNAGHNPPVIKKHDRYCLLDDKPNLIVGAFDSSIYTKHIIKLDPGDQIVLYTDGVTESKCNGVDYGEIRLLKFLNSHKDINPTNICNNILKSVTTYTTEAENLDDITIVCFSYYGKSNKIRLKIPAKPQNFGQLMDESNKILREKEQSFKLINNINICLEEIFVNIAYYAFKDKTGEVVVDIDCSDKQITYTFYDKGVEFDPLSKEDPDTTLSAEDRQIGGLGIFMVKKMMDFTKYSRQNGYNILMISKYLEEKE